MTQQIGSTAQTLGQSLMQLNRSLMEFHKGRLQQTFADCKPSEIRVLFIIKEHTKADAREMKVSEISKLLHVTSPSVTQLLKGLEADGLVERHIDPADRRAVGIVLTEKGRIVTGKAEEIFAASFRGLADYLGEEESSQLAELLTRAVHYFRENNANALQSPWNGDNEA
jgi:DNA-binding MarR family transcriptional regulator